jgi:hypothetical protein
MQIATATWVPLGLVVKDQTFKDQCDDSALAENIRSYIAARAISPTQLAELVQRVNARIDKITNPATQPVGSATPEGDN